jgi:enoyl-CoA hydratase
MTEPDAVLVERDGLVTIVSINRPHCRNAVDGATARKLYDTFLAFDADETASVAVFTGTGGYFCAGADLKAVAAGDPNKKREIGGHNSIAPMGPSRLRLSKPVIAAIEGFAVAGGMELALWADMRVVAEDATFGVFCRRFGVPLIDLGTIRLPRLIGHSQAMDLILTGRPVGGAEALRMGLANRLVAKGETRAQAIQLAKDIARFPQTCMRADRLSALRQWDLEEGAAIANEMRGGLEVIASGRDAVGRDAICLGDRQAWRVRRRWRRRQRVMYPHSHRFHAVIKMLLSRRAALVYQ